MRFPFCKFSRAEGAQKILDFNSVFITSPMDMNDPFEMRPQWTQEHQDHQRDFRNWLNKMSAGMPLMICTTEGLKSGGVMPDLGEEPKLDVEKMWGFADDYNRAVMEFLHQRFRILSLVRHVIDVERDYYNSHREDLLMWAHYADMFQGVAILLDPYKMNCGIKTWKERPGWPIRYKKERMALPVWFYDCLQGHPVSVTPEMNHYISGCIMTLIRTKAVGWRYERETRLIYDTEKLLPAGDFDVIWDACPECKANRNPMEKCQHRLAFDAVKFPPDAVSAVIFGPECPIDYVEPITKILREDRYKHAKLYRSVFHGQEYRLQYMRSTPDEIETFQRSFTERVAMSKGNVKPTADGFSMPKFAGRKGVNLNRKPMSQAPASEPQADTSPRKRATVKVSDVIIDRPYGDAGHFTEPSREQIDEAIAEGRFDERINDGASQKAMYDDVRREAGTDLRRAIELITQYHAQRIAYFVKNGWDEENDRITLTHDGKLRDGGHRFRAARHLGREKVLVEYEPAPEPLPAQT